MEASEYLDRRDHAETTRAAQCGTLRQLLRSLREDYNAPKLDNVVTRHAGIRPRNVKATRDEIDALLAAASPCLHLWILLCSDAAIRSGTAVKIAPEHYDRQRRELTFLSKKGSKVNIPVTDELAETLETCNLHSRVPFMTQIKDRTRRKAGAVRHGDVLDAGPLRHEFKLLRESLGITRKLVLHDLRRTAAVNLYRNTRNVRLVQTLLGHRSLPSTIWYLDNDLEPIERSELEAIKHPYIAWRKERTA